MKGNIGFKGFSKGLMCKGYSSNHMTYELDKWYYKESKENPKLCSNDGFHFCRKLTDVFSYYSNTVSTNEFAIIEWGGNCTHDGNKSIATEIKVVRVLTRDEIDYIVEREKNMIDVEKMELNLNLHVYKQLQEKHPFCFIGGSAALFLHGARLKRWQKGTRSDLDIIMPFYHPLQTDKEMSIAECKNSGNDFDYTFKFESHDDFCLIDVKIDPKQSYDVIEYGGFKYRVSKLIPILEAKLRYAPSNTKHMKDINDMVLFNPSHTRAKGVDREMFSLDFILGF